MRYHPAPDRMSIRASLLLFTMLAVLVPLGVAFTSWRGLERMDAEIARISEEYGEIRRLESIEAAVALSLERLRQEPADGSGALRHLRDAEGALLGYIESQGETGSRGPHQSGELEAAHAAMSRLRETIDSADGLKPEPVLAIQSAVRSLRSLADDSVRSAQASASEIEGSTLRLVLAGSLGTALTCALVATWANRGAMRRLRELHRAVSARAESGHPTRSSDLGAVVREIDVLSERMHRELQQKNRELLRRERVAGVGLLAADVAHELRNPLNAMLGLTELSLRTLADGPLADDRRAEVQESLGVVRREALRCREIVERLMAMVRARGRRVRFDGAAVLAETVHVARAARPDKARCFHVLRPGQPVWVTSSPQEVRQVLLTLLLNAADAIGDDGRIEADVTASDSETWFRVRDDGKGFESASRIELAEPFDTTRADEGGTGLGLSIAHSLAADLEGEIRCFSDGPGKGSLFVLAVPLREAAG